VHIFIDQKTEWIPVFQNSSSQFGVLENGTFFVGKLGKNVLLVLRKNKKLNK